MYQPEELTTLSYVALAIYAATFTMYFVVLFFYGKYRRSPTLFWRSEPIMIVSEMDATQLAQQNQPQTSSSSAVAVMSVGPSSPPPVQQSTASSSAAGAPSPNDGVRSILKRGGSGVYTAEGNAPLPPPSSNAPFPSSPQPQQAAASTVKVSTLHFPKPIHQRWAEVILHTAAINAIQTIRGTITGSTFYGGAGMQVMFLTIYFEGSTPHNQLFVFLISCVALGSVICFIQKLRMTYHLNYLVMVLPRREKTKEELDAEAVGLGVGREDHTVHELRRQEKSRETRHEAIRSATAAAVAAVEAQDPLATSVRLPPRVPTSNASIALASMTDVVVDLNAESFKTQLAKEIEEETRAQIGRQYQQGVCGSDGSAGGVVRPRFDSPVVPITAEQSFPIAVTQVLGSILHKNKQQLETGAPPLTTSASLKIDRSTREFPSIESTKSVTAADDDQAMGSPTTSMLRRRGTLRDFLERSQIADHPPTLPPSDTAAMATGPSSREDSGAGPSSSALSKAATVALPPSSPKRSRAEQASVSLQGSFAKPTAAVTPQTPQPSATFNMVLSPAVSEGGGVLKKGMHRSHSTDGLRPSHKRSLSTGGPNNQHHTSHHSTARFENVALLHMLTGTSATPTPRSTKNAAWPLSAAVALASNNSGHQSPASSSRAQTPVGSFAAPPNNVSFETRYAAKLIAHLAVEEELSFRQHELRLAEVLKLMSANFAVGLRLLFFMVPLVFGLFHDGALIGTTFVVLALTVYMDYTIC